MIFKNFYKKTFGGIDLILLGSLFPLLVSGLVTMKNFNPPAFTASAASANYFFGRQLIWIILGLVVFFAVRSIDWKFLKRNSLFVVLAYIAANLLLILLLILEHRTKGARSWFDLGLFSFEPSDLIKILIILILAKYFSLRHREIANIKHIIISGIYAGVPALLVLIQPDFGSAVIIFAIWFGMIIASGVNKKHLFLLILIIITVAVIGWFYALAPYQKLRIKTFVNPLLDPRGAGYNIAQSKIAAGSGQIFGKGIGYGSQSRLNFLPEPETDFIFAAFAEEWGFLGVSFIFIFFGIFLWRVLSAAFVENIGKSNFEKLMAIGIGFLFFSQFTINVGMNIGLLPVTGLTLPFMSYGGSHLISSFALLGIFSSFARS